MTRSNSLLSVGKISKQAAVQTVLETNIATQKHGLLLSAQDALEIIAARDAILQGRGRVEFGVEMLRSLIIEFAASGFISQDDFAATIVDLLEVFYCLKNQSEDTVGDADLILAMRSLFEGPCAGAVELLRDYELGDILSAHAASKQLWRGVD